MIDVERTEKKKTISPLCLPYISPISALYLPYICPRSALYRTEKKKTSTYSLCNSGRCESQMKRAHRL